MQIGGRLTLPDNITIGSDTYASGTGTIAIGTNANAADNQAMAIGTNAYSSTYKSIAIGTSAKSNWGQASTVIGPDAYSGGHYGVVLGTNANSTGEAGIAIGQLALAGNAESPLAIGRYSQANAQNAIAIGTNANALHAGSIAIGPGAKTTAPNQLMIANSTSNLNTTIHGHLNTTGKIYTPEICLAGDCKTAWPSSSTGGWTNTTTYTQTSLDVNITGRLQVAGNTTYTIPAGASLVCFERFVGTVQNYSRRINASGQIVEQFGAFEVG